MARPKHDNPNLFTGGELSDATGIAPRAFQFLRDNGLGPFPTKDQATGLYEEDTLAEVTMISAGMGAGYPLSLSAALVKSCLSISGAPPARWCFLDYIEPSICYKGESWFHRQVILQSTGLIEPASLTTAHDQDKTLLVADREFVLTGTRGKPRIGMKVGLGVDPFGPIGLGRMQDLKRGAEPKFTSIEAEMGYQFSESPEWTAAEIAYQAAVTGAVALVTVNMSLAIRRAFQRVYVSRLAKGGPLWPMQ